MKRWNKTVMVWDCHITGVQTNIKVTDWHKPEETLFHSVHRVEATALPERTAEIKITIQRVCVSPGVDKPIILERLKAAVANDKAWVKDAEDYSGVYTIGFDLDEKFCDNAIKFVRKIFEALGVADNDGYNLCWFTIKQETFFLLDNNWIPFARWLRINHRLPYYGPEDSSAA